MSQPRPPASGAAAQAWRAGLLRELQPHPLPGERVILKVTAYVDGASRGNPGPAGFGVYMTSDAGEVIEIAGFLGTATNNVAEYSGLIEALTVAHREGATEVEIISDSELLVKQMQGHYRVRHANLLPLYRKAQTMASRFPRFSIRHTLRAGNKNADRLANQAVDRGAGKLEERRRDDRS